MKESYFSDMAMIRDHFPDAVDIQKVERMDFTESVFVAPSVTGWEEADEKTKLEVKEIRTIVELKELEPETGIYAGMSPVTHRVYIYVTEENYL